MNRMLTVVFACVLVALMGFVLVVWLLWPHATTAPATESSLQGGYIQQTNPQTTSVAASPQAQAAKQAFAAEIAPYNNDNVQLLQTSVVAQYALQLWRGDHTGGEALLKFDGRAWIVVSGGGGAWSVGGLVGFGVPTSTAEALLQGLSI